ncbi:MAG TPA: lipid-binding SYLF domain-containing protein [Bryobacteraceae bacterium]|nr:lipid-binding SYLF domain-containing protein [Bryobacteraceae bacterium]
MFKTLVCVVLLTVPATAMAEDAVKRLDSAAGVLSEVMSAPDRGIPLDLLSRASCIVIVPSMKGAAFVVGAKYGKGFISCRKGAEWSAPGAVRVEGGSFGFQIGGQDTDVVMLVMNGRGAQHLLSGQFTLGGEGSVAAGPVGRASTAQTDPSMHAEILSWSRNHGIFAGIAFQGATLRQDLGDNAEMYGQPYRNKQIVDGNIQWPKSGTELESILRKYAFRAGEQRRKS